MDTSISKLPGLQQLSPSTLKKIFRKEFFYFLAIIIAEVCTVVPDVSPLVGISCHITVLIAVILHSALVRGRTHQQLLLSLALVPLVRIISLSMPLSNVPVIWWYPIIYTPLLVATIMVVRVLNIRARDIGFTLALRSLPVQLLVALSGFLIGLAEYFILKPEPIITTLTWQEIWMPALIFLMCTGFVEEFIFRGVLQYAALEVFGWLGIIYVSLLFAILHMGFLSWIDVVFVLVVAVFFAWVVKKTGSLFGVVLSHGIANSVLYVIVPFFF